jgi:O-antigen ligase
MFSYAYRSGWLCVGLTGVLLLWRGKSVRGVIYVAIMAATGAFLMERYGDTELFLFRLKESFSSHNTDSYRWDLFKGCVEVGLENPVLGVSPQNVPSEISRVTHSNWYVADSHNVYGYLIGGTGLIATAVFLYMGWTLYRNPRKASVPAAKTPPDERAIAAHRLLRFMLILWVVRGAFSREILYTPGFCLGLGLVIGLCIVDGVWRPPARAARVRPGAALGNFAN